MIENLDKQEALIWKEALEYAYKQDVNLWKKTRNFVKYTIEYKGVLYPNKYIFEHCITFIKNTYPEFEIIVPSKANNGQRLNDFLKSKGANAISIKDYHTNIMKNNKSKQHIPLNQILFGAPGTGKTHRLINEYFDLFTVKE